MLMRRPITLMNNAIRWLVKLGVEQGLFTREQCARTAAAVGTQAELMDFAQRLIDDGIVEDIGSLETVGDAALAKSALGPPPDDAPGSTRAPRRRFRDEPLPPS